MRALKHIIILLSISLGLASCGIMVPRHAYISNKPDLSEYKYVYITPTAEKTCMVSESYSDQFGVHSSTSSKSVTPSDVIAGYFMKRGFTRTPEIIESQRARTLIVNYGESGRRFRGLTHITEVTLQLLDAGTYELICSLTAEGNGRTETDEVRKAIQKCLDAIFK